jgi:hypothetical protein
MNASAVRGLAVATSTGLIERVLQRMWPKQNSGFLAQFNANKLLLSKGSLSFGNGGLRRSRPFRRRVFFPYLFFTLFPHTRYPRIVSLHLDLQK